MWEKTKVWANSSVLVNTASFGILALIAMAITGVFHYIITGIVLVSLYTANVYVNDQEYICAHTCSKEDMAQIVEHGFNEGVAESKEALDKIGNNHVTTQRGETNNVCFSVTDMGPVRAMREKLEPEAEFKTIYIRLNPNGNLRHSKMITSGFAGIIVNDHGDIIEAGIPREIVNEKIKRGEYVFDEPSDFGKGFNVLLAKVVKAFWTELTVKEVFS